MAEEAEELTSMPTTTLENDDKKEKIEKEVEDLYDENLWQYLFNPRRKTIFGRTKNECFKLTVFYIALYIVLAAFWLLMLFILGQTLDERVPKYRLAESRIGTNPGLGFRPQPRNEHTDSTLIWFKQGNNEQSWKYWSDELSKFLEPYEKANSQTGEHIQRCGGPDGAPDDGKFCHFDIKSINNNCTKQNEFGYKRGDPCVLLKLNRIFDWRPESFTHEDIVRNEALPLVVKRDYWKRINASQLVYITCEGENPADKENIGPIEYYPQQGIEFRYFPYTNQPGYLSPFLFVHFARPAPGVLINIECKAWARNIKHNRQERKGSVHFELLVDGY